MSELQEPPTKRLKPSDESGKVENRGSEDLRAVVSRDVRDASVNLERSADEPSVRFGDFIMSMAKHRIMSIQNGSNPVTAIEAAAVLKVNEGNEKDITTMVSDKHTLRARMDQLKSLDHMVLVDSHLTTFARYTHVYVAQQHAQIVAT